MDEIDFQNYLAWIAGTPDLVQHSATWQEMVAP